MNLHLKEFPFALGVLCSVPAFALGWLLGTIFTWVF